MEEGPIKYASGGDDIKVWDLASSVPLHQFSPHSGPISGLCWNQNNQLLASTSSVGDKVVLTYTKNEATNVIELANGEKQTCVVLNSSSRYLACGGKNKLVSIWDLRSKKIKRTYKEHRDSIACVIFNWNDTYLASGSASGEILLHNVVTGQASAPMLVSKSQTIRDLGYSYFKKALLAAASDDGSLTLWDTNTNKMVTSFSDAHNAPATALSFSPLNNLLLASSGLDKTVVCYDVNGKSVIKTMTVESPLTALSFMHDGATLAAGSTRGKIYIFDLRMGSSPLKTINAHKSSVQSIRFQNPPSAAKANGPSSKSSRTASSQKKSSSSSISSSTREPSEPSSLIPDNMKASKESLNEKTSSAEPSPRYEQLDNMDIISPIREGGDPMTVRLPVRNGTTSVTDDRPETMGKAETQQRHNSLPGSGIFSPLSSDMDNPTTDNSVRRNPIGSVALEASPFGQIRRALPSHTDGLDNGSTVNSVRFKSPLYTEFSPANPPSPRRTSFPTTPIDTRPIPTSLNLPPVGLDADVISPATTPSGHPPVFSPEEPPPSKFPRSFPSPAPALSSHLGDRPEMRMEDAAAAVAEEREEEGAVGSSSQHDTPFQTFQVEFIKNLIEESLDQFRVAIHRDVTNLQLEMLRQFQIQQTEIQSLLERYSVNEGLLTEIETLREENKRLKSKF